MIVRLPKRFYDDHVSRDLPAGEIVKTLSDLYEVALSDTDAAELLSDARYYSNAVDLMGADYLGLQASARATVARLTKAGVQ